MGKREENKAKREQAVLRAARDVFLSHDYESVTTSQLAEAAGLTTGTFFRHAGSKAELLISVYTEVLEHGLAAEKALPASAGLLERAHALIDPIVEATEESRGNMLAFQREVLFGTSTGPRRENAIKLIRDFERRIYAYVRGRDIGRDAARQVAASIYAIMYMGLVRVTIDSSEVKNMRGRLHEQIKFIADGMKL